MLALIVVTVTGIAIERRPLPENASVPIAFSCDPIPKVADVKDTQLKKALSSIIVTASGIATESRPLLENAL